MKLIVELLLIAILAMCIWQGYKKGIIMGVFGILIIIVSLYGANLLSTTFSYEVIPAMKPFVSGYMEKLYSAVTEEAGVEETGWSMEDFLAQHPDQQPAFCSSVYQKLGLYSDVADRMADETVTLAQSQETGIREAIIAVTCERVAYIAGFLLALVMLLILLTVLFNITNIGFKLPGLPLTDAIGGTILGLATGLFYCVVLCWAVRFFGIVLKEESIAHGGLTAWFLNHNFLTKYIGI